ncbi:MAG: hypothetical protein JSW50_08390, partial [Candidatus Latescibacterota bacterium]
GIVIGPVSADAGEWDTYYEKSGGKATPRYEDTIEYCKRLDKASRWVRYTTFGVSPQGRDLPLVILSREKIFSPAEAARARRKGRLVLLIQAGIHSGEIAGKDAGLMLIRDIAIEKKFADLLDRVTVLFMPIFSVDGHERFDAYNRINQDGPEEMGWRTTAANLNLNRDYLKADASEMHDWLRLYNAWLPDFFIDCHTTNGTDYQYAATYVVDIHGNMAPDLTRWAREVFVPALENGMAAAGHPIFPYVSFARWGDPTSGLVAWVSPPRLSQGYTSLRNRPGLLIEAHSRKPYSVRVEATYEMLRQTLEILDKNHRGLSDAIRSADRLAASDEFRKEPFPLRFSVDRSDSVMIDFLGVEYKGVQSDLSGGVWYQYSGDPVTMRIPYFAKQKVTAAAELPEAYIVPAEWGVVIDRLELHDIEFVRLSDPATVSVESYRFSSVEWQRQPYEGRHAVTCEIEPIVAERTFAAGSAVIDMNQPKARVIAHMLEPKAPDSFVSWGFFDSIFEQKEYADRDVLEQLARDMLAEDEALREEFEAARAADEEFANNPRRILYWFYERTPYWDDRKNVYPIGKITDRRVVDDLQR